MNGEFSSPSIMAILQPKSPKWLELSHYCHNLRQINSILDILIAEIPHQTVLARDATEIQKVRKTTMYIKDIYGCHVPPPHPGEVLREDILPALTLSRRDIAAHLRVSPRRLADLIAERRDIDLDMARRLGAAFGQGAHFWLALQMQRDLWMARQSEPPAVRRLQAGDFAPRRARVPVPATSRLATASRSDA
jgi:addiction module HigA family antidote